MAEYSPMDTNRGQAGHTVGTLSCLEWWNIAQQFAHSLQSTDYKQTKMPNCLKLHLQSLEINSTLPSFVTGCDDFDIHEDFIDF